MLPLLDLHGLRRLDFHTSVLEVSEKKISINYNEVSNYSSFYNPLKLHCVLVTFIRILGVGKKKMYFRDPSVT